MSEEKSKKIRFNKKFIVIIILIFLLLIMYAFLGRIRANVVPNYAQTLHKQPLQKTYDKLKDDLGDPLQTLELNDSYLNYRNAGCSMNTAARLYVEVGCSVYNTGHSKPINENYIQKHIQELERLENKFLSEGWIKTQSQNTPSTYKELLNSKDQRFGGYVGYIRYDKDINGYNCYFDLARFEYLGGVLSCSKKVKVGIGS